VEKCKKQTTAGSAKSLCSLSLVAAFIREAIEIWRRLEWWSFLLWLFSQCVWLRN